MVFKTDEGKSTAISAGAITVAGETLAVIGLRLLRRDKQTSTLRRAIGAGFGAVVGSLGGPVGMAIGAGIGATTSGKSTSIISVITSAQAFTIRVPTTDIAALELAAGVKLSA